MDNKPAAGSFYIDMHGRAYWSQSKNDDISGPDIQIEIQKQPSQKSQGKPRKTSTASEAVQEKAPEISSSDAQHTIWSIESTEDYLKKQGVDFNLIRHTPTMTNAEMFDAIKFQGEYSSALLAKQLFCYDKKNKEKTFLMCAEVNTSINLKEVAKSVGVKPDNFRAADADVLFKQLGCKKGMVNYLAILNDLENKVTVLYDKKLFEGKWQSFHPMDNSASCCINAQGVNKIKQLAGKDDSTFQIIDFESMGGAVANADPKPAAQKPKKDKEKPTQGNQKGQKLTKQQLAEKKQKEKDERSKDVHDEAIQFKKEVNFSKWYSDIITKAELIGYYDISGCYILRPRSFYIWENIQGFLDAKFKSSGVQNCYFPIFVSERALNKEKNHIEGFSPEVAWVTKNGQKDLDEPIAIRPTSETIMYPAFSKWVRSHRDLPLKLNQWSNVVRWEFKHPTPFIRTREFLWQEGHTVHASVEECTEFVKEILEHYASCYEQLLAVPVIRGTKSEEETFAGAYFSKTTEIYVPINGRGIQGATSHNLGQNFSKMFEVEYEDKAGKRQFAWQASWGFSTRSIGAMIMVHSDDKGLVLPPKVAQEQVVVIPIIKAADNQDEILDYAHDVMKKLKAVGVRTIMDDRDSKNPGNKFAHWELRGIPIRIEIGKQEVSKSEIRYAKRNDGQKGNFAVGDLTGKIEQMLSDIHNEMYQKALDARINHQKDVFDWETFMSEIMQRNICNTPWCGVRSCEAAVNDKSKEESESALEGDENEALLTGAAKTLCIPDEQKELPKDCKCFHCGQPATKWAVWGRTF